MSVPRRCPYETLGVKSSSRDKEIKEAYRKLVFKYHPDKFANATEHQKAQAKRKFQEVSEAFEAVGNRANRNRYDSRGRYGRAHQGWHAYAGGASAEAYTSAGYTPRRPPNPLKSFFSAFSKVSVHELALMAGVVSVVFLGTSAMDHAFTSMWNTHNEGKLFGTTSHRDQGSSSKTKAAAEKQKQKTKTKKAPGTRRARPPREE
ncbi:DnaJ domain-containing protein [Chloropicon primus]|uniref:DnaJ domain-containing protein n=1 Tax=Chloropicon primus TaxID=1764295 RepID=A0A5B8MDS2_9CHLO|nr:DnaJ domain-containing protein [Chloropicon primus]|mmetsp:Transcript_3226/g.8957  ORF Transcript_3226/g.8957 Transcript_3226/m.8957 type:complete len:204 (+) Transcript_3226:2263-2874(+)|eukprot:QDZ18411.1 DnaJ domain-containing protein [Chloropicon primus]